MERFRRVVHLWSWLPAFQAAAETENLQRAAELLRISPSAISRAIRLLEENLGQPLFHRAGRHLELNAGGRELLGSLRDATRLVDEGLVGATSSQLSGPFPVGADGHVAEQLMVSALATVMADAPRLVPQVRLCRTAELVELLLRGHIDLALCESVTELAGGIEAFEIGRLSYGVYAGASHPLAAAPPASADLLSRYPFVVPEPARAFDPWPRHFPRQVALLLSHPAAALEACAAGQLLVVVADRLAAPEVAAGRLRRVSTDLDLASRVSMLVRGSPRTGARVERLTAALRGVLEPRDATIPINATACSNNRQ